MQSSRPIDSAIAERCFHLFWKSMDVTMPDVWADFGRRAARVCVTSKRKIKSSTSSIRGNPLCSASRSGSRTASLARGPSTTAALARVALRVATVDQPSSATSMAPPWDQRSDAFSHRLRPRAPARIRALFRVEASAPLPSDGQCPSCCISRMPTSAWTRASARRTLPHASDSVQRALR